MIIIKSVNTIFKDEFLGLDNNFFISYRVTAAAKKKKGDDNALPQRC